MTLSSGKRCPCQGSADHLNRAQSASARQISAKSERGKGEADVAVVRRVTALSKWWSVWPSARMEPGWRVAPYGSRLATGGYDGVPILGPCHWQATGPTAPRAVSPGRNIPIRRVISALPAWVGQIGQPDTDFLRAAIQAVPSLMNAWVAFRPELSIAGLEPPSMLQTRQKPSARLARPGRRARANFSLGGPQAAGESREARWLSQPGI